VTCQRTTVKFVVDLRLARYDPAGGLVIANPIYREVVPRVLANSSQDSLPYISPTWLKPNGSLDAGKLLAAFLAFWPQHGQPLLGSVHSHEVAAQLVMMAFLHRVVNGNGTLHARRRVRNRHAPRGSLPALRRARAGDPEIEIKGWRDGEDEPLAEGLANSTPIWTGSVYSNFAWTPIPDQTSSPNAEKSRQRIYARVLMNLAGNRGVSTRLPGLMW
jgi:hypothetical protein